MLFFFNIGKVGKKMRHFRKVKEMLKMNQIESLGQKKSKSYPWCPVHSGGLSDSLISNLFFNIC